MRDKHKPDNYNCPWDELTDCTDSEITSLVDFDNYRKYLNKLFHVKSFFYYHESQNYIVLEIPETLSLNDVIPVAAHHKKIRKELINVRSKKIPESYLDPEYEESIERLFNIANTWPGMREYSLKAASQETVLLLLSSFDQWKYAHSKDELQKLANQQNIYIVAEVKQRHGLGFGHTYYDFYNHKSINYSFYSYPGSADDADTIDKEEISIIDETLPEQEILDYELSLKRYYSK